MLVKLLIVSLTLFLSSCSFFQKDNLQKFADGDVAIWKYHDGSISSEEKDCSKVIENSNGVVIFKYVKDGRLINFLYWGKKTTHSKYTEDKTSRYMFGKDAGWVTYFKIRENKRSGDSLVMTAIRDDGLISDNYFSTTDGISLFGSGWSYLNPNEEQASSYKILKEHILKKQAFEVCNTSTLMKYVSDSEALNKKLPDSHFYLGSRLIDLVPDDAKVNPLPNSLEKFIFECLFQKSDDYMSKRAVNCQLKKISPTYKARIGESINIIAITPNCCLNSVEVTSSESTFEEPLDLFANLPGVIKREVECKELSKDNNIGYSAKFYQVLKNGSPKFSIREVSSGGSGGGNIDTTIYYGMPEINCSRISDMDDMERKNNLLRK